MRGAKEDSKKVCLCNCTKVIDIYWDVKDCLGAGWSKKSVGIKLKRFFYVNLYVPVRLSSGDFRLEGTSLVH